MAKIHDTPAVVVITVTEYYEYSLRTESIGMVEYLCRIIAVVSNYGIHTCATDYHVRAKSAIFLRSKLILRVNIPRILEEVMAVGFYGFLYVLSQPGQGNHAVFNA